jgi:hypothetical protein
MSPSALFSSSIISIHFALQSKSGSAACQEMPLLQ